MQNSRLWLTVSMTAGLIAAVASSEGQAQEVGSSIGHDASIRGYWTPKRMKSVQPVEVKRAHPREVAPESREKSPVMTLPGSLPGKTGFGPAVDLYDPDPPEAADEREPRQSSSVGAHFTTSRVFPDAALSVYPYITTGKLMFRDPRTGGNSVCTASVYAARLIITAGHCVFHPSANPSQRYWYTNFIFVPGLVAGRGPVGTWTARIAGTTPSWANGNGSVPNAQDVGVLEINDQVVGGVARKISNYTGTYALQTGSLNPNHITALGYPCNIDNCDRMQQTNAQIYKFNGNNTYMMGSAMRGGASGGPWLKNFGVPGTGYPSEGHNIIKSVSSYGSTPTEPKYIGASELNGEFVNLHNIMCAARAGNC